MISFVFLFRLLDWDRFDNRACGTRQDVEIHFPAGLPVQYYFGNRSESWYKSTTQ